MSERVYPPIIAAAKLAFRLLKLRFVTVGLEQVPPAGGAVLVSNHVSYLDFIFCGFAAQPSRRLVRFMAKDAVFRHKVSGPLMRGMHHIPVDRSAGAAAYDAAVAALRRGELVGVFPEATISRSFTLKEFKTGAARMAIAAGVPIVPMVTWGGQRMMTKGRQRDFRRGRTIALTVGEPLRPGPDADPVAVTADLRERMAALLERTWAAYPDTPDGPDDGFWVPAHLGGTAPTREQAAALEATERTQLAAS
ncbi:MAG: 1-acyl-sn-glycerol-3-phosphate acyltransferase [Actinomycetota bacterium]|nr:1-acyl-sn-glycerol-3-phosphate acyltransferase [Actinomycetota bacterium]